jgi:hypothetical protein
MCPIQLEPPQLWHVGFATSLQSVREMDEEIAARFWLAFGVFFLQCEGFRPFL